MRTLISICAEILQGESRVAFGLPVGFRHCVHLIRNVRNADPTTPRAVPEEHSVSIGGGVAVPHNPAECESKGEDSKCQSGQRSENKCGLSRFSSQQLATCERCSDAPGYTSSKSRSQPCYPRNHCFSQRRLDRPRMKQVDDPAPQQPSAKRWQLAKGRRGAHGNSEPFTPSCPGRTIKVEHAGNAIQFLTGLDAAHLYRLTTGKVGVPDDKNLVTWRLYTAPELSTTPWLNRSIKADLLPRGLGVLILLIELFFLVCGHPP